MQKLGKHWLSVFLLVAVLVAVALIAAGNGSAERPGASTLVNYHLADKSDIPEATAPLTLIYTPPSAPAASSSEEAQAKTFSMVMVSTIMMGALIGAIGYVVWRRRQMKPGENDDRKMRIAARMAMVALFGLVAVSMVMVVAEEGSAAITWIVDKSGGGDYTTIQGAIDDEDVYDGDTILVRPGVSDGVYEENVIVHKSLTLREKRYIPPFDDIRVTIDGGSGTAVLILKPDVVVEDFIIKSSDCAVHIQGEESGARVENNEISLLCPHAVIISGSHNPNTIKGNDMSGGDIRVTNTSSVNTIENNSHVSYIHFGNTNGSVIRNNGCWLSNAGIDLDNSDGNEIRDNMIGAYSSIFLESSHDNIIKNNDVEYGDADITLLYSDNNTIEEHYSSMNNTHDFRIEMVGSDNNVVRNNSCHFAGGISLEDSHYNLLSNNSCSQTEV